MVQRRLLNGARPWSQLRISTGRGTLTVISSHGHHEHSVPWWPFVLSVLNSRIKVEVAPGIVHPPLVFLNKHVIERRHEHLW